jgi:hypothetical protein
MKYKNLLVVAFIIVFGAGMWGVGWVVANPIQPWPSLDSGGRTGGGLGAVAGIAAAGRAA